MMPSDEELLDETSRRTLELRNLQSTHQSKMEQFRAFFEELETERQSVRRSHFPPKYFLMKDMVREQSRRAAELLEAMEQEVGNGAGEDHAERRGGGLLQVCKNFSSTAGEVRELETIRRELKKLKRSELQEELRRITAQLDRLRADYQTAKDLLQNLVSLYRDHKHDWPWRRYKNLLRSVKRILYSFAEITSRGP